MIVTVVGLAFEARIAAGAATNVICGRDGLTLSSALRHAITKGCQGFVSFGVAGGLAPELRPGTCVVASDILAGTARYATDTAWSRALLKAIPDAIHGTILGVSSAVAHPDAKRALFLGTGAAAVDMESHVVASTAAEHGLPMIAIRVVADSAERALPQAALAAVRPDGTISIGALTRHLLRHPRELPAMVRTALDCGAARTTLKQHRHVLGSVSAGLAAAWSAWQERRAALEALLDPL